MRILHARIQHLIMPLICIVGLSSCGEDSSQTLLSEAKSSIKSGDKKAAVIQLKSAIQKDEDNAEDRFELAKIQITQRDFASAEKELRRPAVAQYLLLNQQIPNNFVMLNNLVSILTEINDKRALPFAEQAYKLKPKNPAVMDTLGWLLVREGKAPRGLDLLKEALSLAPDAADTHYHLAYALFKTGDQARARQELERLLASGVAFSQQQARALHAQLQNK